MKRAIYEGIRLLAVVAAGVGMLCAQQPGRSEIDELKQLLADQQRQINELRQTLAQQSAALRAAGIQREEREAFPVAVSPGGYASTGQVASVVPVIPAGAAVLPAASALAVVPQAAPLASAPSAAAGGPSISEVGRRVDGLLRSLGGFRFSGDFRYRFDLQDRSSNSVAGPLQNARSRYRLRLNADKDVYLREGSDQPFARLHMQLSTAPYNNEITNDADFNGFGTKSPFSLSEVFVDVFPVKGLSFRIGRTAEVFADNRQFIWDDDLRLNGFHETYRLGGKNGLFAELRAGQYILTNPNVQVVAAGSPYLNAGYALGQRIAATTLFDQGLVVGRNLGKKWSTDVTFGYFSVGDPNQIQLASTAAGQGLVTSSVLGTAISSPLTGTGNATRTPGGAIYSADGFDVLHYGWNLSYRGSTWRGHNYPFQFFAQATHNMAASMQNNGYMIGAAVGQAARLGDVQFQYAYFYKPANAFVSQFTDDDVGTASGVNVKDSTIRLNFGITRWLAWENRLFIQHGIARSDPARNFFVPLPAGYNTLIRYQSHLMFTF